MSKLEYTPAFPAITAAQVYSGHVTVEEALQDGAFEGRAYEFSGEFRSFKKGEVFRNDAGYLQRSNYSSVETSPRLIFRPVKKYRFVLESLTPRVPKKGEWYNRYPDIKATEDFQIDQAEEDFFSVRCLIFRREEVTE